MTDESVNESNGNLKVYEDASRKAKNGFGGGIYNTITTCGGEEPVNMIKCSGLLTEPPKEVYI